MVSAQSAIGLNYTGHSVDLLFLMLAMCGFIVWAIRVKPSPKIAGRLFIGFVLTVVFIGGLQIINNVIFDPIFLSK
jgi:hypothetical protein